MKKLIEDIKTFHKAMGLLVADKPSIPSQDIVLLRQRLLDEEFEEYNHAASYDDVVELLDALIDMQVIIMGTAASYGLLGMMEEAWDEVQRSNMAKVYPDGTVKRRVDGKVLKPEGWTPPDIKGILERHGWVQPEEPSAY